MRELSHPPEQWRGGHAEKDVNQTVGKCAEGTASDFPEARHDGAEEEPEKSDWNFVGEHRPELFDTATGRKLHYRRSCRGLEKARTVFKVRQCPCWLAADTWWPEAAEEITIYRRGRHRMACNAAGRCAKLAGLRCTVKQMCLICGNHYREEVSGEAEDGG